MLWGTFQSSWLQQKRTKIQVKEPGEQQSAVHAGGGEGVKDMAVSGIKDCREDTGEEADESIC